MFYPRVGPVSVPASVPPLPQPTSRPACISKRKKRIRIATTSYKQDRLGKIVSESVRSFCRAPSWSQYARSARPMSRLSKKLRSLRHRAAPYLNRLRRKGASAKVSSPHWSRTLLEQRLLRGPHKSATEHNEFVRDEFADFCDSGFWTVLPYDLVKDIPNLRLSPLGVVPQRDRRPRLIVDLSFYGLNAETIRQAPPESMQFGRALERILFRVRHADPKHGPVYLCKLDISDGFYRIPLNVRDAPLLAVILPQEPGEPPLVAIPLSLPMGWVESPPYFCAATETVADLANERLNRNYAPPHPLETVSCTPTPPTPLPPVPATRPNVATVSSLPAPPPSVSTTPLRDPLSYVDVYMDDFMGMAQGNARRRRMVRRILLHAIEDVFRPVSDADGPNEKAPQSIKKMLQGDASWETLKVILGWLIDTVRQTIRLPSHRVARLLDIFSELREARRVSITRWQQVLGELRSMLIAIPGGRGLFSILQTGFRYADKHRIRLDSHVHAQLDDFEALALDLASRPTRLAELISDALAAIGSVDASGTGMGGVWFTVDGRPLLWRERFPPDIVSRLVSSSNPTGDLTNSDFELTGVVAHQDILAQARDVREASISVLNDNTPAVSRSVKGSITSRDPAAYLLRISSLHRRHHRYNADFQHISGPANAMADDLSRLWKLTDADLLAHFQQMYPQPLPWKLCHLRPEMRFALISALHKKRVDPPLFLNVPEHETTPGISGKTFAWSSPLIHSSTPSLTQFTTSWSLPSGTETAALRKMASPSDLGLWRRNYAPSARRWPVWGPKIIA